MKDALKFMREWQARQPTPEQMLGAPPWTREKLEKAYFSDFRKVWDVLETHPGHQLYDHIECLTQSFALFDLAVRDLIGAIYRFQHLFRERSLQSRRRKIVIEAIKLDLEKNLFAASQAALALVDHSRRVSEKVTVPGYDEQKAGFANDPAHQFLQGLRACLFHVFYISPDWEYRDDRKTGEKARFLIQKKQLLRYGNWNPIAKQYIETINEKLDLESFLREYREKVRLFQSWFVTKLRHSDPDCLTDYLEARRILKAIGAKSWWNLVLTQVVIQNHRDAFDYLDRFLDPAELERVYSFPFRSKEQVDYIITLMDEFGACDDPLRQVAYRAFKIVSVDGTPIDKSPQQKGAL